MEEILASIKRIIAEDGDASRAVQRAHVAEPDHDPVLELTDPYSPQGDGGDDTIGGDDHMTPEETARPEPFETVRRSPRGLTDDQLLSEGALDASRRALAALAVAPAGEPGEPRGPAADGSRTIDQLACDLLRPMLREWLDAELPALVERLVRAEIERIARER